MRLNKPEQFVGIAFDGLSALVRNLLIENKNFENGIYFRELPRTDEYVRTVLKPHAQAILDRIKEVRSLSVDMAADEETSNVRRSTRRSTGKVTVRVRQRRSDEEMDLDPTAAGACDLEAA